MVEKIIRYHRWILLIMLALVIASLMSVSSLKLEVDFSSFFPKGDPELTFYQDYKRRLGGAEWSMYVAVQNRDGVFDSVFLGRAMRFVDGCDTLKNVRSIQSLFKLNQMRRTATGYLSWPYLRVHSSNLKQDSVLIYRDWPVTQFFIAKDATFLVFSFLLKENISLDETARLVDQIDSLADANNIPAPRLFGQKYLESQYKQLVNAEMRQSILLTLGFIIVVLVFLFRRLSALVVPLMCVMVSLVIFYGYLALFGRPLTIMANLFPTILLIVGIADIIHVCTAYGDSLLLGMNRKAAVAITIKEVGFTNLMTSLTTAAGFLTLLTSSMEALQNFGIDAAVGVMIAFAVTALLAPSMICWLGFEHSFLEEKSILRANWMHAVYRFVESRKTTIVTTAAICVVLGIAGLFLLNLNNYILATIPKDSRLFTDYSFFDRQAGGSRVLEWSVVAQPGHQLNETPLLRQAEQFHQYLQSQKSISSVISPVTLYGWANRVQFPGSSWRIPADPERVAVLNSLALKASDKLVFHLLDSSRVYSRFVAVTPDQGRLNANAFLRRTQDWISVNLDKQLITIQATGMNFLMDRGHEHRVQNLFQGLVLAVLVVSMLVGLVFKRIQYVIIVLVVNLIPLVMALGFMGVIGLELRGTTSIVFAIGFVIISDDTLHFISRFRLELARLGSVREAVMGAILHAGKANISTAMILVGGFSILMTSGLGDVYAQGVMISFMLVAGCLMNLFLVPVLLLIFIPEKNAHC